MVGRARAVTDFQTVADCFGHISLGRLNGLDDRPAVCEMGGNSRRIRATGAVRMRRFDEITLEHVEESTVIEQVGGPFGEQMPALDEDVLATEAMNDFGRAAGIRKRGDSNA